jgi:hypothetical protein
LIHRLQDAKIISNIATDLTCSPYQAVAAWLQQLRIPVVYSSDDISLCDLASITTAASLTLTPRHVRFMLKLDHHVRTLNDSAITPGSDLRSVMWDEPACDATTGVPKPGSVLCHLDDIKEVCLFAFINVVLSLALTDFLRSRDQR